MLPHQGVAALIGAITCVVVVMTIFLIANRSEKKHQAENEDEH